MSARDEMIEYVDQQAAMVRADYCMGCDCEAEDEAKVRALLDAYAAEVRLATLREVRKDAYALNNAPGVDPYLWGYGGSEICRMISAKVRSAQPGA